MLQKYLTGGFCGHAQDGSPVRVEPYGRLDIKGLMCSVRKSDLEKAKIQQCEWTVLDWQKESQKVIKGSLSRQNVAKESQSRQKVAKES